MNPDKKEKKDSKTTPKNSKKTAKTSPKSPGIKPFPGQGKAPASAQSPTSGGASTGASTLTLEAAVAAKQAQKKVEEVKLAQDVVNDPSLDKSLLAEDEAQLLEMGKRTLKSQKKELTAFDREHKKTRKMANLIMKKYGDDPMYPSESEGSEVDSDSQAGTSKSYSAAVAGSSKPTLSTVEEEELLRRKEDEEDVDMDISTDEEEELLAEPLAPLEPVEIDETTGWPKGFQWYAKDQFVGYWQRFIEIPRQKRWLISFNREGQPVYVRNPGNGNPNRPLRMKESPELALRLKNLPYGISQAEWNALQAEKKAARQRKRQLAAEKAAEKAAQKAAAEQEETRKKAAQFDLLSGQFGEILKRLERQEEENKALRAVLEGKDSGRGRASQRERQAPSGRTQDHSQSSRKGDKKKKQQKKRKEPHHRSKSRDAKREKVEPKKEARKEPKKEAPATVTSADVAEPKPGPSGVSPAGPFGKKAGTAPTKKPKQKTRPHYTQPADPREMTPKNTLLQKLLVDESFENSPVIPTYLCYKCGKAGHKKDQCQATVQCRYANCVQMGRAALHATKVCPWIMAKCSYCQIRGHPKMEPLCAHPRDTLVARFEEVADEHVLTRWRRACYNWGVHIFPNKATMLDVQEDYTYDQIAKLSRRKFKDLL